MSRKIPNILGFICIIILLSSFCFADSQLYIYMIGDKELVCNPVLDKQYGNIFVTLFNVTCVPEWECSSYNSCGITNTQTCGAILDIYSCGVTYTGNFSEFPAQSCNFCSENIQVIDTECYDDGTAIQKFNRSYTDLNYGSCCAVTGLISDCHILDFPYNEIEVRSCTSQFNTTNTIDCNVETNAEYGVGNDKINWFCNINQTTENNVTCISYVKDVNAGIVQTNPSYNNQSDTLITQSIEDRTSFMAENGLVQVYFTKDNLVFDKRDYIYGVKCSDGTTITEYQKISIPEYESVSAPITRFMWAKENASGLILGIIIFSVLVLLFAIGRKILLGRK